MAAATKICKVCGKEYEYCRTNRTVAGVFRYQDVACSAEHGSIYLARVIESRKEKPFEEDVVSEDTVVVTDFSDLVDDEEDESFEDDFEDEDDEDNEAE